MGWNRMGSISDRYYHWSTASGAIEYKMIYHPDSLSQIHYPGWNLTDQDQQKVKTHNHRLCPLANIPLLANTGPLADVLLLG